jgi:hypothetical protein
VSVPSSLGLHTAGRCWWTQPRIGSPTLQWAGLDSLRAAAAYAATAAAERSAEFAGLIDTMLPKMKLIKGFALENSSLPTWGSRNVPISVGFSPHLTVENAFSILLHLSLILHIPSGDYLSARFILQPCLLAHRRRRSMLVLSSSMHSLNVDPRRFHLSLKALNSISDPIYWNSSGHDHDHPSCSEHSHAASTSAPITSSKPAAVAAVDKHEYSNLRIAAYLNDASSFQILHRHTSGKESVEVHTTSTQAYLDAFDAAVEGSNE